MQMSATKGENNTEKKTGNNRLMGTLIKFVLVISQHGKEEVTKYSFQSYNKLLSLEETINKGPKFMIENLAIIEADDGHLYETDEFMPTVTVGDRFMLETCKCGQTEWFEYTDFPSIFECDSCIKEEPIYLREEDTYEGDFNTQDEVDNNPETYYRDA